MLLLIFLMISFQQLHAQIKAGLRFGPNYPDIARLHPQESNGFHLGTYMKISFAGILVVEPGVQFSQRKFSTPPANPGNRVRLDYLDVPLIARVSILPFVHVFGGPQASVLIGKKYRGAGSFDHTKDLPNQELGAVAGIGINLPLGINVQGSYDFGLSDLEYDGHLTKNRIFKISLGKDF